MLRVTKLIGSSTLITGNLVSCECAATNSLYSQIIRWKRKPIWLPTAKSKMFRVPVKPVIPKEDNDELQRLSNIYRTYMRSLRKYMIMIGKKNEIQFDHSVVEAAEAADFEKCSAINNEWNEEIADIRKYRLHKERTQRDVGNWWRMKNYKEMLAENQEKVEEEVRSVKKQAESFITAENIDQAIEEALTIVIDHNAAIDHDGNFYKGEYSDTKIDIKQERQLKQ
ncbi:probable 28S ribosomal protein S26, mitochondrial isoform X2 [Cephus cinctus]|nr:probable 28S ribosomal protein S26, mitochondrial isoform X2 [Cephus cinctus]